MIDAALSPKRGPWAGQPLAERFWAKVDKSGGPDACWPWLAAARRPAGYGCMRVSGPMVSAHRIAYELARGPIGDLFVCHRCDNPPCCNPAHLFLGTNAENHRDRDAKGRRVNRRGTDHGQAKLTDAIVVDLRRRHANGESSGALAREIGVSARTVRDAVRRVTWGHVA